MKVSLILACAGQGKRAGFNKNKLLVRMKDGLTVFEKTLSAFRNSKLIDEYIISASAVDKEQLTLLSNGDCIIVEGGETRTDSVKNALALVTGDVVLIHDGARPFVTAKMIKDCIDLAFEKGGCIPVVPTKDTMVSGLNDVCYLGKSGIYSVQTPQGFRTNLIINAYAHAGARTYNDDGEVYKNFTGELYTYEGDVDNVKLTFKEDFKTENPEYRFGVGFDSHRLVENRKLILGGITIPHDKGLLGHSDADVLTHAIMDAILSASANRDIGYHFSDKDPAFKDADSMKLLERVLEMTKNLGYKVSSISASIMAEKPKLLKIIPGISKNLASALELPLDKVGISATTLEGLGFVGREEGICVHATATLIKI